MFACMYIAGKLCDFIIHNNLVYVELVQGDMKAH